MEEIYQKTHNIILELIPNISSEELLGDTDIFIMGLDSINAMTLILKLQDAFGVKFEISEINFENFRTIKDIVELTKKKKAQ